MTLQGEMQNPFVSGVQCWDEKEVCSSICSSYFTGYHSYWSYRLGLRITQQAQHGYLLLRPTVNLQIIQSSLIHPGPCGYPGESCGSARAAAPTLIYAPGRGGGSHSIETNVGWLED